MIFYAQEQWPEMAAKINALFKLEPPLQTDHYAIFDYFLAVLFVQSRSVFNIYNKEQGDNVWKYLINTFSVEPHHGDYANESLDFYCTVWEEYIDKRLNPFVGIASVLLNKLGHKDKGSDILLGNTIMETLICSPPWWKIFSKSNELVKSDVPLGIEAFKEFLGESEISPTDNLKDKPDGTYQYCDNQGKMQEGWMPPEKIENILKESGAKKLTKVLIKGPWEGAREDFWDIDNETIGNFADSEGTIYVMCVYEKGEPTYNYVSKRMWVNVERIRQIIMNPLLSEEDKKYQIEKLK